MNFLFLFFNKKFSDCETVKMQFLFSVSILFLCWTCALCATSTAAKSTANNIKWRSQSQEALDEVNDAELLKAVQLSMIDWSLKHHKHHRKKRAIKKVCYDELGCFEDSGPFSYLEMLPSSPEEINTRFYFYSTKNRSDGPLLELPFLNMTAAMDALGSPKNESETTTPFSKPQFTMDDLNGFDEISTRVIVHGFGSSCPHVWIYELKTALMAVENCTVICVDWENGATFPNYVRAAANSRLVGKQLAMLLRNLQKHKNLDLSKTHIIGFSLGAHVAGFAGAELPGLSRITGLDPAGPLFESQHPSVRLDITDASFVDVIHSNGENLILGGLGSWQPLGHVDFYPNGGRVQHGCSNLFVGAVTDFIWSQAPDVEGRSLCNHRRAYKFFIDSVAPRCQFPAFPCDSYESFLEGKCFPCNKEINDDRCGNMGYYADRSTGRGQLYLITREEEPFCAHQFLLEIHNSFNDLPLRTIGKLEATLEGEGGLNETFLVTEKEDTEFFAGDVVSRIIVPHPALGFPQSLTLQYKSYSGWLTKGLPHWDVDKVVLTDSFGRSFSYCKPTLSLSSGRPIYLNLQKGVCDIPEVVDTTASTTSDPTEDAVTQPGQEDVDDEDGVETVKHRKDIFNLGPNFKITSNKSLSLSEQEESLHNQPWQPILEGNSLDREAAETSRSLSSSSHIFEPVLKESEPTVHKGRNMPGFEPTKEIVEPILKPTTPKVRKVKEISVDELEDQKTKPAEVLTGPVTVQLFPFRLGELLERAERYARETLLPLISEQAPRFFGLGGDKDESDRKPRYIPRYEEETFKKLHQTPKISRRTERTQRNNIMSIPKTPKNILELARLSAEPTQAATKSSTYSYYTNKASEPLNPEDPIPFEPNRGRIGRSQQIESAESTTKSVEFPYSFETPTTFASTVTTPPTTDIIPQSTIATTKSNDTKL